jgi:adenylate cyclase class 2
MFQTTETRALGAGFCCYTVPIMREIEVKARLQRKEEVLEKIQALGCVFSEPVTQDDTVYVLNVGTLGTFLANNVFLRIRVQNDKKILFTVKNRTQDLVATEHEVEVNSREEMENILLSLGYKAAIRVKKERQKTLYNGCEICIDDVEDLGTFIEMEKLTEEGDPTEIQDELFSFLVSVGVSPEDRVTKGYDILMFEK